MSIISCQHPKQRTHPERALAAPSPKQGPPTHQDEKALTRRSPKEAACPLQSRGDSLYAFMQNRPVTRELQKSSRPTGHSFRIRFGSTQQKVTLLESSAGCAQRQRWTKSFPRRLQASGLKNFLLSTSNYLSAGFALSATGLQDYKLRISGLWDPGQHFKGMQRKEGY